VWTARINPACLYLLDATRDTDPPCRPLPAATFALWLVPRGGKLWISDTSDRMRVISTPDASATAAPSIADRPFITYSGGGPNCALQDREGNIWFGTVSGLEQMRVARLRSHGPFAKNVTLAAGNHNSLWVGTTHPDRPPGQDFFRLDDALMVPYAGGPTGILASYREPTGALWVGGFGRLWRLEDRKWEEMSVPPELAPAATSGRIPTQSITRDTSGAVWLSVARAGLFKLQNAHWERVLVPGIPASEYPVVIHADAKSSVWFGYPHGRVASLNRGAWHLYTEKEGITVGSVQVVGDVNGEIWIGGDRGLGRIRDDRFEPLRSLDALGSITGLLQAKSGDLWLSTSIGAAHIDGRELNRFSANPRKTPHYDALNFLDGMPGVAPAIRPLPTVLQSDDGHIWFEAQNSFASLDPTEHIRNDVAPTVIIRSVTDDGRRRASQPSLALVPKVRNVAIEYTATSLSIPSRVRFKYRLEDFDSAWQDVGTRRTAYYNNLPPGHFVFRVIAANDDGVWNTRGAVVSLFVPPLFYQTLSFRALAVVLVVLVVGALFFGRLRQVTDRDRKRLEQRMEDRLNERTRIARELHDSLLQGFQGLMFRLQAVRQLLPARAVDAAKFLDSALQVADQAIGEGRDAVQNLRSPTFDDCDLTTSLGALGAELGIGIEREAPPEYRVVVEGRARELRPGVRDDAYRIVREAVRNAYQHANARHIEIEVTFGEADLSIRVRDDGIGVDPQILARGQRAGHWGLPGMRERSESFGGRLYVWSETNAGTEVELRIAAEVAYARPPAVTSSRIGELFRPSR
jgi:signal transduction histidine kinase